MHSPCVSIIVPVYNAENYLVDCLDSILSQTFLDFEVLIVDDGSVDNSLSLCRDYQNSDSRFKIFSQENAGAAAARNFALDVCTGEWIAFLDADDLLANDSIERLLAAAESTNSDIALGGYGAFVSTPGNARYVIPDVNKTPLMPSEALAKILYQDGLDIAPWGKLFKRELFDGVRFPLLKSSEDLATIYKPFLKAHSVALIEDSGYRYRQVEGSLSYSIHESEAWEVMRNAAKDIVACYPELQLPCYCRRLSFAFHIFLITNDPIVRKKTWNEILTTRKYVLCDSSARKKAKAGALVSFFGAYLMRKIGMKLRFAR